MTSRPLLGKPLVEGLFLVFQTGQIPTMGTLHIGHAPKYRGVAL